MQLLDFDFTLPEQLIARYPLAERRSSRLLYLDGANGAIRHQQFTDVLDFVTPQDLLLFNNTRVIPARLFGLKKTGGKVEILVERFLARNSVRALVRSSKTLLEGMTITLADQTEITLLAREKNYFILQFPHEPLEILNRLGHIPLPPYLKRPAEAIDQERYQTVYAKHDGAVAAPTAGLHFDQALLAELTKRGIALDFVTLHVGLGTFQPVRVTDITKHRMHAEYAEVSAAVCEKIRLSRARGGRVIAVGTTTLRCLETAALSGEMKPWCGETDIFIYPGFQFRCVDALITNFHLPQSSLMMLVSAFAGHGAIMQAYREAIVEGYRFFSYGDAMFICVAPQNRVNCATSKIFK